MAVFEVRAPVRTPPQKTLQKKLPGHVLVEQTPLEQLPDTSSLLVFLGPKLSVTNALIAATSLTRGFSTELAHYVSKNGYVRGKGKRRDFNACDKTDYQERINDFLVNTLGMQDTKTEKMRSDIITTALHARRLILPCLAPGTKLSARLVCGHAGRGEDFHDDTRKIVATIAFSGPGTDFISNASGTFLNGRLQPIPNQILCVYAVPERMLLLMRGSMWGNDQGKENPSYLQPGLIHRKPKPELCKHRFALVLHANGDWMHGVQRRRQCAVSHHATRLLEELRYPSRVRA